MIICVISFGPVESRSNGYFIRVWNIIKEISKFHKVVVLEFPETKLGDTFKSVDNMIFIRLRGNEISSHGLMKIIKKVITFNPIQLFRFQVLSFIELWRYRNTISKADIVIIEGSLIPSGNILAKLLGKKVILDTHCINKLLAKGYRGRNLFIYYLRTILWGILEKFTIKLSDIIITASNYEKNFVVYEYKVKESRVFVIPNVVDPPKKVSKNVVEKLRKSLGLEDKIIVTFVGDLESVQNADAVEYIINELAPWMWERRKDVVFLIIGRGGERFRCNLPNIIFTGFVKDLAPYLEMSDIYIAPLRVGAGTKTKILQYLTYCKPVLTTFKGIEGLEHHITKGSIIVTEQKKFKDNLYKLCAEIYEDNDRHICENVELLLRLNIDFRRILYIIEGCSR